MSLWGQVAKTQQETELMISVLPQMHPMSNDPQVPKLLPKQVCCTMIRRRSSVAGLSTHGALRDLVKEILACDSKAKNRNSGKNGGAHCVSCMARIPGLYWSDRVYIVEGIYETNSQGAHPAL
jgi:hypothetical protein